MPEKSPKPNRPENILSRGIARPSIEPQSRSIALSTEMNTGRIEVGSSEKSRNEPRSRDHILRRERKRAPADQHLEDLKNARKFATKPNHTGSNFCERSRHGPRTVSLCENYWPQLGISLFLALLLLLFGLLAGFHISNVNLRNGLGEKMNISHRRRDHQAPSSIFGSETRCEPVSRERRGPIRLLRPRIPSSLRGTKSKKTTNHRHPTLDSMHADSRVSTSPRSANNYYRTVGKFRRSATRRENLNQSQYGCPGLANFSIYLPCGMLCASRNRDLSTCVHSVHDVPYN